MTNASAGAGSRWEPARAHFAAAAGRPAGALWVVRHGETEWSRAGRHTGRTNVPLSTRGERQASALAPMLGRLRPALVLHSPRSRATRTAELAGLLATAADSAADEDLAEWDYGRYEGRTSEDIHATHPGWALWVDGAPGGESPAQVAARADRVLDRAHAALAHGDVVAVGHGHFSRVLAARWLGLPPDAGAMFTLGPAAPCALGWEHDAPAVLHWNIPNPIDQTDPEAQ